MIGNVGHPLQPVFLRKIDFADAPCSQRKYGLCLLHYAHIVYGNTVCAAESQVLRIPGGVLLPVQVIRPVAFPSQKKTGIVQHFRTQFFIFVIVLLIQLFQSGASLDSQRMERYVIGAQAPYPFKTVPEIRCIFTRKTRDKVSVDAVYTDSFRQLEGSDRVLHCMTAVSYTHLLPALRR